MIKVVAIVAVATFAGAASAQNLFVNPSFELGTFLPNGDNTMDLGPGSANIAGWSVTGPGVAWIGTPNPFSLLPSDGTKFLDLTDYPGVAGGVFQVVALTPGASYRITFDQGSGYYGNSYLRVLVTDSMGTVASSDFTEIGIAQSRWFAHSVDFVARSASTTITFGHFFGAGNYTGLDNVSLELAGPSCDPDVNQDGVADQGDVDYLINVIAGGDNPTGIDADFNQDGVADQGDIDALINVIAGGPCP